MAVEGDEAARQGDTPGVMSEWLVQWPMTAFTGWWDTVFDALQPKRCPDHADECLDLAIPDPIEREGEHDLFA
ncbi:hypothetical protein OF829_13145 [Sphingomonas sp. LB-2]|uniref:hypothetical protein n=1 Tax=Sphingomonas caeni TaxID=2984949 RepID=UPI00222FDEA5|nr:hypothetical protein [Sphingomonas caeni]MCW3848186.1 hypothetical protein [Sphingomonas caeni]